MQLSRTLWWTWALSAIYPVFGGFQLIAGAITEEMTPTGARLADSLILVLILLVAALSLIVYFVGLLRPSRFLFGSLLPVAVLVLAVVAREAFNGTEDVPLLVFISTAIFLVVTTACLVRGRNQTAT